MTRINMCSGISKQFIEGMYWNMCTFSFYCTCTVHASCTHAWWWIHLNPGDPDEVFLCAGIACLGSENSQDLLQDLLV